MSDDPHMKIRFAAWAAGYAVRTRPIDLIEITRLKLRTQDVLPQQSRLRRAVEGFCDQVRDSRYDADALDRLGRTMVAYIDALNMPEGPERSDIHG